MYSRILSKSLISTVGFIVSKVQKGRGCLRETKYALEKATKCCGEFYTLVTEEYDYFLTFIVRHFEDNVRLGS